MSLGTAEIAEILGLMRFVEDEDLHPGWFRDLMWYGRLKSGLLVEKDAIFAGNPHISAEFVTETFA